MLTPQVTLTMSRTPKARKNELATTPDSSEVYLDMVGQKAAIIQETAETLGKLAFKAYFAKRMLDTVCEIAVIVAKAKLK